MRGLCYIYCAQSKASVTIGPSRMRCVLQTNSSSQLHEIAQALNLPVEAFFATARSAFDPAGGADLIRYWQQIPDADGRERLLRLARELAGRSEECLRTAE